jgi:hypothetical protein
MMLWGRFENLAEFPSFVPNTVYAYAYPVWERKGQFRHFLNVSPKTTMTCMQ